MKEAVRTVGIAGLGTIGRVVGRALDDGIEGLRLVAVAAGRRAPAEAELAGYRHQVPVVDAATLAAQAEIIVECVPKAAFAAIAGPALDAGRILVTVSGAGLLAYPELVERARAAGGHIILATGALLGLDAVRAAAEGNIRSVRMVTRKPPRSLAGAPYLAAQGISVEGLSAPLRVFEGTAREGAAGFPANVNVAAALGLAGIGADATTLEIWADPGLRRNTHMIAVDADSACFTMTIENVPSDDNPGTGRITALSVIAALRGLVAPLRVGS